MQLEGKVVVVTGGGRGIGRAIAELFYAEGARVAVASRDSKGLQNMTSAVNRGDHHIVPFRCDVRSRGEVEVMFGNVIEVWDRIDILVNNSGQSGITPLQPTGEDGDRESVDKLWKEILDTNLTGMYYCTSEAVRHMPDGKGGRVINISSVLGKFGVPGYGAYCASKHGVIGLTRAHALELAPRGITVNAICPGWVDTEMARRGVEEGARRGGMAADDFRRAAASRVPLGRFLQPEEVARMALFVASAAADGMTGQAINFDGGAAMW